MTRYDAQNGEFLAAIMAQIGPSAEDDILPMISHISNKIMRKLWVSKMAPFRELITAGAA